MKNKAQTKYCAESLSLKITSGFELWFVIHNYVLNFHEGILSQQEPFHDKIKRWKPLELSMDLWHLNKMKAIVTLWTLNYVVFLFLVLILSVLFTTEPTNLKNLTLEFLKNMIKPLLMILTRKNLLNSLQEYLLGCF